ncbi:fatty acyl-AMP ligase [Actinocorallia sp. A-T 12471]|uniref:fatty acyl-AMP ligase n=1 Tax=Actinocorallia sp. A-T 12471 TaxID=3089813 RepID=UPI0029CEABD0|nr:fatty acyl-AMP ligase [Actinocorallia sp. A-T 12471]MDX6742528.1 fatty acyl-AMP ligase [Actinocorallia sp. A-T 12471]
MALGSLLPDLDRRPLVGLLAEHAVTKPDAKAFTFVDYSTDREGAKRTLTWSEVWHKAKAMAVSLREYAEPGDRAALLLPQSLDYLTAMSGAFAAQIVAVPLFSPDLPGNADRLIRAYSDAAPAVIVTTAAALPYVEKFLDEHPVPRPRGIVLSDEIDDSVGEGYELPEIGPDDLAYLQYTSGSTSAPAGVEITHGGFAANARQLWTSWDPPEIETCEAVTWLPLFHDMGLVTALALPLVHGNHVILADPMSFLMRPIRWMRLLSECPNVYTAGPNFAYDYVAGQANAKSLEGLDLSGVNVCLNGAEPIRPSTVENFTRAFAPVGLRAGVVRPAYGLAEATVFVSGSFVTNPDPNVPARMLKADREALTQGRIVPSDAPAAQSLVSCGAPQGQHVAIVDPDTRRERPDGVVGEIWVHGPNVGLGYWNNAERSAETFGAVIEDAQGVPAGGWMRTGDFGAVHDGELYVTGRIKDLIIVDGRNHYPQDVEVTTEAASPAIRPDYVAAFSVPGEETERLVVVAERNRRLPVAKLDLAEVERAVRAKVNQVHEMHIHEFVLIEPGSLSRTSSGKVARAATRARYLDGDLVRTADRLAR